MSIPITPQQLTAINLRYGTTAKSLKTLAFADLSAKALFLLHKPLTTKEVAKKVAELIAIRTVSEDLIKRGLEELKTDRRVCIINGKWELGEEARQNIGKSASCFLDVFGRVLNRNFPKNIEEDELTAWFTDAIADFFAYNGDEWVQSVCKGSRRFSRSIKTTDEILGASIKKHGLNVYSAELKNSFKSFLASANTEDQSYLTNVGFAMFSARLVAADVGADPIALGELRGATFLIDTNFLFTLQLEGHRFVASLEALGQSLGVIGARLSNLNETRDEYQRVWTGKRKEILKLVEVYPNEIVAGTDDEFISTAIARGCSDTEGFETFFQSIYEPPHQMPGKLIMDVLENQEIVKEVERAKNDSTLKSSLQRWYLKLKPYWKPPKSNSALGHDAALIGVLEFERKAGNKVFILTLDRSLQACCAERVGRHEIPPAIHLEGLIQILAANNAGAELDATNFAPLLTSILLKRCVPPEYMYSTQDLHWLYNIQKNVSGFKPEKIKQIALEVMKARLSGRGINDEKLQRTVNRLYQEEIQNTNRVVEESMDRAMKAEEEAERERAERLKLEDRLRDKEKIETLRVAKWRLAKSLFWRILAAFVLAIVSFTIVSFVLSVLKKESVLDFMISVVTLLCGGYKFIKKPIEDYLLTRRSMK